MARSSPGDIVLITAHTHKAVDELLLRLDRLLPILQEHATNSRLSLPSIKLSKVHSKEIKITGGNIYDFSAESCFKKINDLRGKKTTKKTTQYNSVLVIGGTTGAILKMLEKLEKLKTFTQSYPQGFQTTTLIVDEASMMVFPHFLALATLVKNDGEIMLAGDHRQLTPIITHDWENEDRSTVGFYRIINNY